MTSSFTALGLNQAILQAVSELGYSLPTPIQAKSIPSLLDGRDILAQAQTGTGKTAAFALPILQNLSITNRAVQALVLVPTRELAIQVVAAFTQYAKHVNGFKVLSIYGGREYDTQLRGLKQGTHVVVGTPGRVMDHLRRGTLKIDSITTLVLDEADEMLRMGFIDDVKWILQHVKKPHQTALFSATIPDSIRSIAKQFLNDPVKVQIKADLSAVNAIKQQCMLVAKKHKLEALTGYFDTETIDAAIVFTGTKSFSVEIADQLCARGYRAAALNGDMNQSVREKVMSKLKNGDLNIIVATEVAARGLDVERISHVINFDIPQSAESYVHRIGRTGRAGRHGKTLLFVTPKEQSLLHSIEKMVGFPIEMIKPLSFQDRQAIRTEKFKSTVIRALSEKKLAPYHKMIQSIQQDTTYSPLDIAAALAYLMHKNSDSAPQEIPELSFDKKASAPSRRRKFPKKRSSSFSKKKRPARKGDRKR